MAAQNASNVLGLELETVDKRLPVLFERNVTFYSKIEKKNVEKVSDRDMRIPLEMRPGGYFGHFDDNGGDLGRGSAAQFDKALLSTVKLRQAVEFTKRTEWATDDKRKATLNVFKDNLAKAMKDFRRGVDSLCSTSGNGVLATIESVTSTAGGNDTYLLDREVGAKLLRFGQKVNIYDTTLATQRTPNNVEINFYDLPNRTIKVPNVTSSAATDKIVIEGVSGASPVSMLGVYYHHSDASTGQWLGFDRATTPEIRGNRVNANGAGFALPFPRLAINKMMDRVGDEDVPKLTAWMHPCQVQAYEEQGQLIMDIQKTSKEEGLNLYFGRNGMQMAGVPMAQSFKWSKKRIDFINYPFWGRAEMHAPGFYDVDGRKLFEARGASGGVATSTMFYIVASFNLYMNNPAGGAYIDGLAIPSGY